MTADKFLGEMQGIGFSEYEARAYVMLLERGPLTGYQLAQATAIPRPNIYPVLDRLQSRGAASRVEVKGGTRYVALPAEEMLDRLGRDLSAKLRSARKALRGLQEAASPEVVWNLYGYEAVVNRARAMVESASTRILAGIWSNEAVRLAGAMAAAEARGVKVTTLCFQGCAQECGGCRGEIYRYPMSAADKRSLVLTVDEDEMLAAQTALDGNATGAMTRLEVYVSIGSQYLLNAIATAEIARSLGPRLGEVLDERAKRTLEGAGLATAGAPWLDRMLSVVGQGPE